MSRIGSERTRDCGTLARWVSRLGKADADAVAVPPAIVRVSQLAPRASLVEIAGFPNPESHAAGEGLLLCLARDNCCA